MFSKRGEMHANNSCRHYRRNVPGYHAYRDGSGYGVYRVSHGHGRYAGIRGHGHYVLHGLFVTRHTAHGCGHKPIAVQTVIRAHGPTTVLP
jgi:hypothetical protein